ncbi:MAG: hypothetical protein ACJ79K_17290 [Gemmatimonadaceae bacterium]
MLTSSPVEVTMRRSCLTLMLAALSLAGMSLAVPRRAEAQQKAKGHPTARRQARLPPLGVDSACHTGLFPLPTSDAELLVDVVFHASEDSASTVPRAAGAGPRFGPMPDDVRAVEALGARVVYRFTAPGVRVRVAGDRLRAIGRIAEDIVAVPEPRRHDLLVVFTYPYWPDDTTARGMREILAREHEWKTLGGHLLEPFAESAGYMGVIPDRALRHLLMTRRGTHAAWVPGGCDTGTYDLSR